MNPVTIQKPHRTEAQQQASRQNGSQSRGPNTPEGKKQSSKSAIRHGLTATENALLMTEDPEQYKDVCAAFIDELQPQTKVELRLAEKLANLEWRLERLVIMETALYNMAAGVHAEEILEEFEHIDGIGLIVESWRKSAGADGCHDLLRRYMGTLQHQFDSTMKNYEKFEARRLSRPVSEARKTAAVPETAEIKPDSPPIPNEPKEIASEPAPLRNEPETSDPKADATRNETEKVTPIDAQKREKSQPQSEMTGPRLNSPTGGR